MPTFIIIVFLVGLALPSRWALRLAGLVMISLGFLVFQRAPQIQGPMIEPGEIVLLQTIMAIVLGMLIHVGIEVWHYGKLCVATRDMVALRVVDTGLFALFGSWFGILVFSRLSDVLAGIGWPMTAHIVIVLLALGLIYGCLRWRRGRQWPVTLGFGLALLWMVDSSALRYPVRVLAAVEDIAQGAPRCLMLGAHGKPPGGAMDLMAMTLPKKAPSALVLVVGQETGGKPAYYRWSFWGHRFEPLDTDPAEAGCVPNRDRLFAAKELP